jgi:hypothetical protein
MRTTLLLGLALACGDPPAVSGTPANPDAAPPPTATQQGGDTRVQAEAPPAPAAPTTENNELIIACRNAMDEFPDEPSARRSSASELNTVGYRCYRAGMLPQARHLFLLALRLDETHALAHYNLACTLMLLRRAGEVCEHDATLGAAMHHLERAVAIDAKRKTRMKEDEDLVELRDNLRYRMLAGVRMGDPVSVRKALKGVTVYGPGVGAFGTLRTLTFEGAGDGGPDSRVRVSIRSLDDGMPSEPVERKGYWDAQPGRLVIKLPTDVEGGGTMVLTPQGDILNADGSATAWYAAPSECDA